MNASDVPVLDAADLRRIGSQRPQAPCATCASLRAPGWEALPGSFDRSRLQRIGTLRQPGLEEPTLAEYHPAGTNAWSPDAPIAPSWFPYNRCDVSACLQCGRPFLRYVEVGGYYEEERLRELDPALVVDVPAGAGM